MRIAVYGIEPSMQRSVEHLIRLFEEDARIDFLETDPPGGNAPFSEEGSADLIVSAAVKQRGGRLFGEALLLDAKTGVQRKGEHAREGEPAGSGEEWRRIVRQTVQMAILSAFEQHTGLRQPWGILTGIRPTKLFHEKLARGIGPEEAQERIRKETGVSEEKIALMRRIVQRQYAALPDLYRLRGEVSVYIGIPFCPTKCAYCTFPAYDIQGRQGSVDAFLASLHYEMRQIGRWLKDNGIPVTTVYFGGGTPTSITAEEMDRLYEELYESFPNAERIREITVEAGRPDTITEKKLDVLKKWNIHRISINPQTYTQATLDAIGRHHTVEETIEKFRLARAMGMKNINMDLIIGLPGETSEQFRHTLAETEKLMPESLTVHTLSFKRASEMTRQKKEGKASVAARQEIRDMMRLAETWTRRNGYEPYYLYRQKNILGNLENVGYAKPGSESLYNILIIEELQTIVGLGSGAASKWVHPVTGEISRFANPKEPKAYIENVKAYTAKKIEALRELFFESRTARMG